MSAILATLAGVPLLALESVGWRLTEGVDPYQRYFEAGRAAIDAIWDRSRGTDVELVIVAGNGEPLIVKHLHVLSRGPGTHPRRCSVLVADRRCRWKDKLVRRFMNVRRRNGETRLVEDDKLERLPPVADIDFARYSLENEIREWTPERAIKSVLEEVTDFAYRVDATDFTTALELDTIRILNSGDLAVAQVLSYVPSLKVFLDQEGTAVVDSRQGGAELRELGARNPVALGQTLTELVDLSRARPSGIDVYVVPEDEVRFDFLEGITDAHAFRVVEPRTMTNVMPLPDRRLTIAGKEYFQGSIVEIDQDLLDAWNADPDASRVLNFGGRSVTLPPITFEIIQRLWLAPGGYHAYFELAGGDSVWGRRWSAIKAHYRQTFQINPRWIDRIQGLEAVRASIADAETRTRATSDVYADHCFVWGVHRIAQFRADPSKKLASNRKAWDDIADASRLLDDAHVAETARVQVVDRDTGIIRLVFQPDASGRAQTVLPSLMAAKADGGAVDIPDADPRTPLGLFMIGLGRLATKHRASVVLTVVPASPQGLAGLYKIEVTPAQAKRVVAPKVAQRIGACEGPRRAIFVGVTSARFAWLDSSADEIEQAVLKGGPRSPSRLVDPKLVRDICEAAAAAIYADLADRPEGAHVTTLDGARLPRGRISAVVHGLDPSGRALTRLDLPADVAPVDFLSLLPESARDILGKVRRR